MSSNGKGGTTAKKTDLTYVAEALNFFFKVEGVLHRGEKSVMRAFSKERHTASELYEMFA